MYLLFSFFLLFSILYFLSYNIIVFQYVLVPGTDSVENNVLFFFIF